MDHLYVGPQFGSHHLQRRPHGTHEEYRFVQEGEKLKKKTRKIPPASSHLASGISLISEMSQRDKPSQSVAQEWREGDGLIKLEHFETFVIYEFPICLHATTSGTTMTFPRKGAYFTFYFFLTRHQNSISLPSQIDCNRIFQRSTACPWQLPNPQFHHLLISTKIP